MTSEPLQAAADVAVIGAGPAGLACATELKRLGVERVVVFERMPVAGGIPRHCAHSPFGMREFHRILSGPAYAKALVARALAAGVVIRTDTSLVAIDEHGGLRLAVEDGVLQFHARRIVLATGVRETSRAGRLVSGQRPTGILTTGALQRLVHEYGRQPFKHPVIVGSELVSFSALLTCRSAGIKPVAMIEANERVTAWRYSRLLPRLQNIPLWNNTTLASIDGDPVVESVTVRSTSGSTQKIECDGVVFTGRFVPEAHVAERSGIAVDSFTNGPVVDQLRRCSLLQVFAAGNLLRSVETAGWCWQEGKDIARTVFMSLNGELPDSDSRQNGVNQIEIASKQIAYCMPQVLIPSEEHGYPFSQDTRYGGQLQLRVTEPVNGELVLQSGAQALARKRIKTLPERRIVLPLPPEIPDQNLSVRIVHD